MPQANISLLSTTVIHSYSSQDTSYGLTWSNLLDNSLLTNGASANGNPSNQWIIIDLGSIWPLVGFKLWNATLPDDLWDTNVYSIDVSTTGINEGDFTQIIPSTFIPSKQPIVGGTGYSARAISSTNARYVRLNLLSNKGSPTRIAASQFEIYSSTIDQITTQITSDAEIFLPTNTVTITSDAFINIPTYTDSISITSDAEITDTKSDIRSDAYIVDAYIYSDAVIEATETETILSDAYIYRNKTISTNVLLFGQATLTSGSFNAFIYTTDISSSDEVVINDMITSSVIDMNTVRPPLGYNNYDWKYDWVTRAFNKCQYKFEARSSDNLLELSAEPFHEIQLGEQIYKGQVNRYHQWRCHVWASGSGDFELHQFTIKGYIENPANPLYRALYEKPFITTSHVTSPSDSWTQQLYEPPLSAIEYVGSYLPGDLDGSWDITVDDATLLQQVIFGILSESSILSPGFSARGLYSDLDGETAPDIGDVVLITRYLTIAGPPPSRREELT